MLEVAAARRQPAHGQGRHTQQVTMGRCAALQVTHTVLGRMTEAAATGALSCPPV